MNPFILLGVGLTLLFVSKSKSSSSSSQKEDEKSSAKLAGDLVIDSQEKVDPIGGSDIGTSTSKCTQNQYLKNSTCITFWSETIEQQIKEKLKAKTDSYIVTMLPINNKLGLPHPFIVLCLDISSDPAFTIIKETIHEIWPNTKNIVFPPDQKTPSWIKIIWQRTNDIFKKDICQK